MLLLTGVALAAVPLPDLDDPLRTGRHATADAAVVVGLEDYVFLPDVPYARRDADAVSDYFVSTRGIPIARVTSLSAANREQIVAAVTAAGVSARAGGTVWVYFAGHGVASPTDGRRLLLGDDARQAPEAFEARGVAVDDLDRVAGAGGARVVMMIDACFNGTGRSGEAMVRGTRFAVPDWATTVGAGRLHWSAAGPDQVARPLDAVQHGAFTWLALGAMRGWADGEVDGTRDEVVTAAEAQIYLKRSMRSVGLTSQEPMLRTAAAEKWVLAPYAPEEAPDLAAVAALSTTRPVPVATAPRPPGSLWDPELMAVADLYHVELPLNHGLLGFKDASGRRVDRGTYMDLVRATRYGRRSIAHRTVGIAAATVGWGVAAGFGAAALAQEQGALAVPASAGLAVCFTGMGLLVEGQLGIQNAVDPGR